MQNHARLSALTASAALAFCALTAPVYAQDAEPAEAARGEQADAPASSSSVDGEAGSKKPDLLFAPVPFSNPSTGTGLAGGVVAFYNPNNGLQQWISGAGVVWTERGSKGVAGFHSMSVNDDRFRIMALVSYFDAVQKFYGIGIADGDRGEVLELATRPSMQSCTRRCGCFRAAMPASSTA